MGNRKTNENIFYYVFGGVFAGVGIVMLIAGILFAVSSISFMRNSQKIEGTISDIIAYRDNDGDLEHEVYVEYDFEGSHYEKVLNEYSSSMYIGKTITLYVDPQNPRSARGNGNVYLLPIIFSAMGIIFTGVGLPFLLIGIRKKRLRKDLMENGERLYAVVVGNGINHTYTVNGRHPYWLDCQYQDPYTGEQYLFRSGHVWEDPCCYMGLQIPVYVNRNDRAKYYVAVEELQQFRTGEAVVHDYR